MNLDLKQQQYMLINLIHLLGYDYVQLTHLQCRLQRRG